MVKGLFIEDAQRITDGDILRELGGLPEGRLHCATFFMNALRKALADYIRGMRTEK
jgi:NifU-like protein